MAARIVRRKTLLYAAAPNKLHDVQILTDFGAVSGEQRAIASSDLRLFAESFRTVRR
jgi:hypothetical protein